MAQEVSPPATTVIQKRYFRLHISAKIPIPAEIGSDKTPDARAMVAPRYISRFCSENPNSLAISVKFGAMRFCGDQIAMKAIPKRSDCACTVSCARSARLLLFAEYKCVVVGIDVDVDANVDINVNIDFDFEVEVSYGVMGEMRSRRIRFGEAGGVRSCRS